MRSGSNGQFLMGAFALACSGESADALNDIYESADVGCDVLVCPAGVANCCTEVIATASDSELGDYDRRPDLLRSFVQSSSEVRADFVFNVVDQAGEIAFNLGRQRHLSSLGVLLATNASPSSIVVTFSDATNSGCVASIASDVVTGGVPMSYEVDLLVDDLCFLCGTPGAGSVLEFGVYADRPGEVSLAIQRVELN
jgi:hypothetical protein